jgi:2-dehydro-3-deoxygalactonokinase
MPAQFLSCDWGTSSFRLRLVSADRILAELSDSDGVRSIFDSIGPNDDRAERFEDSLASKLSALAAAHSVADQTPLIISGMASSSIGWIELPYAQAPFALDGSGLEIERITWNSPEWLGPTYLVSGTATDDDIMRGEECQIIGLMAEPLLASLRRKCLLVLPGTHSKHVWIENATVVRFRTYMTGELFGTLATKTILRATTNMAEPTWKHRKTFTDGCAYVRKHGLAASFFQVRTRAVLKKISPEENIAFLSGIIIGAEMMDATDSPLLIAAKPNLIDAYSLAAEASALWAQMDTATTNGHRLILSRLLNEL